MESIGNTGDPRNAYECGNTIGTYLKHYGFDIDFAPVADVNTNPENIIIGPRAFSSDPAVATPMVTNYLQGLKDAGITGCIKHFPGHGDTKNDTHFGYAQTLKTWDQMKECEMVTFKAGIQWGCQLIMTAHIGAPNVTGSDVPSTMSPVILQNKLRGELGYKNIIITDGMEMGAITQQYTSAQAAVGSILAGVDIVLGPRYFTEAFDAVMEAVRNGTIPEERINQRCDDFLLEMARKDLHEKKEPRSREELRKDPEFIQFNTWCEDLVCWEDKNGLAGKPIVVGGGKSMPPLLAELVEAGDKEKVELYKKLFPDFAKRLHSAKEAYFAKKEESKTIVTGLSL
jgi:beta-glucosidase-like glycosyl hydrolase